MKRRPAARPFLSSSAALPRLFLSAVAPGLTLSLSFLIYLLFRLLAGLVSVLSRLLLSIRGYPTFLGIAFLEARLIPEAPFLSLDDVYSL